MPKLAYNLESWGELFWPSSIFLILLALIVLPILAYFTGWQVLLFIFVPIFMAVISMFMRGKAQTILYKKGFRYNYEDDISFMKN